MSGFKDREAKRTGVVGSLIGLPSMANEAVEDQLRETIKEKGLNNDNIVSSEQNISIKSNDIQPTTKKQRHRNQPELKRIGYRRLIGLIKILIKPFRK